MKAYSRGVDNQPLHFSCYHHWYFSSSHYLSERMKAPVDLCGKGSQEHFQIHVKITTTSVPGMIRKLVWGGEVRRYLHLNHNYLQSFTPKSWTNNLKQVLFMKNAEHTAPARYSMANIPCQATFMTVSNDSYFYPFASCFYAENYMKYTMRTLDSTNSKQEMDGYFKKRLDIQKQKESVCMCLLNCTKRRLIWIRRGSSVWMT